MRTISYRQSAYLVPWKWRKRQALARFILEIPYALYFSVVPGREALNQVLLKGSAGGGMGTGLYWEPLTLSQDEYDEVLAFWRTFDLRTVLRVRPEDIPDLRFVFDEEVMSIPVHLQYLRRSREKYSERFSPSPAH